MTEVSLESWQNDLAEELETVTAASINDADILFRASAKLREMKPRVFIQPMTLSGGRTDYFVTIRIGDREVTPHVFREEFKSAYHVALYDWLLNGSGEEPELMDFSKNDWPARIVRSPAVDRAKGLSIHRLIDSISGPENALERHYVDGDISDSGKLVAFGNSELMKESDVSLLLEGLSALLNQTTDAENVSGIQMDAIEIAAAAGKPLSLLPTSREILRRVVDAACCYAMELPCFLQTTTADNIIDAALAGKPPESVIRARGPANIGEATAITERLGSWLSAALEDPQVCEEMKADIRAWMEAGMPNVQPSADTALVTTCHHCGTDNPCDEKCPNYDSADPAVSDDTGRELKPCPFCGEQPKVFCDHHAVEGDRYWIVCGNPACSVHEKQAKGCAFDAWNTRAALSAAPVGEPWRDISTAPKDGRDVLLYYPLEGLSSDWPRVIIGYYRDGHNYWVRQGRAVSGYSIEYQPTHWKPLDTPDSTPPAPAASVEPLLQLQTLWRALDDGPKPRCRDCADHDGHCPNDHDLPCDPQERALEQIRRLRSAPVGEPDGWQARKLTHPSIGWTNWYDVSIAEAQYLQDLIVKGVKNVEVRGLYAGPPPRPVAQESVAWRHKKRGTVYVEVARGPLQASTRQPAEDDTIVCYRGTDGRHFFREATEFEDGRFERVEAPTAPPATSAGVEAVRRQHAQLIIPNLLSRLDHLGSGDVIRLSGLERDIVRNGLSIILALLSRGAGIENGRVREALKHAQTRFECLAEDFENAGKNVDWAMCQTDAERMASALAAVAGIPAGTVVDTAAKYLSALRVALAKPVTAQQVSDARRMLETIRPFTSRPMGGEGSRARLDQESRKAAFDELSEFLIRLEQTS